MLVVVFVNMNLPLPLLVLQVAVPAHHHPAVVLLHQVLLHHLAVLHPQVVVWLSVQEMVQEFLLFVVKGIPTLVLVGFKLVASLVLQVVSALVGAMLVVGLVNLILLLPLAVAVVAVLLLPLVVAP